MNFTFIYKTIFAAWGALVLLEALLFTFADPALGRIIDSKKKGIYSYTCLVEYKVVTGGEERQTWLDCGRNSRDASEGRFIDLRILPGLNRPVKDSFFFAAFYYSGYGLGLSVFIIIGLLFFDPNVKHKRN